MKSNSAPKSPVRAAENAVDRTDLADNPRLSGRSLALRLAVRPERPQLALNRIIGDLFDELIKILFLEITAYRFKPAPNLVL